MGRRTHQSLVHSLEFRAAAPVYALFGPAPKLPEERPALDQLLNERLGYFIRPGKHAMTTGDWKVWLDYADKWLR